MPRPLCPFNWFGGKSAMLKHILPVIDGAPHHTYVEPFGGSAAVLLNKAPSPVEIYNDIYSDVTTFFRVLRTRGEELVGAIELTPYSREEFAESCDRPSGLDEVERARRFFVVARQVMMGLATTATPGRWCVAPKQSRRGMSLVVSRWLSAVERLPEVVGRLREVVIENEDALDTVRRYDGPDTLFYVDPPYPMGTRSGGRSYKHEFTDKHHASLLEALRGCKGKVVVSSYRNEIYESVLGGWSERSITSSSRAAHFYKGAELKRDEVLWSNFPVSEFR